MMLQRFLELLNEASLELHRLEGNDVDLPEDADELWQKMTQVIERHKKET